GSNAGFWSVTGDGWSMSSGMRWSMVDFQVPRTDCQSVLHWGACLLLAVELGGEAANALDHGGQAIAPPHAQVMIQTQAREELLHVEAENLVGFLTGENRFQNRQFPADDGGIAVRKKLDHVGRTGPLARCHKHGALAAMHAIALDLELVGQG